MASDCRCAQSSSNSRMEAPLEPIRKSVAAALSEGTSGASIRELLLDWAQRQSLVI